MAFKSFALAATSLVLSINVNAETILQIDSQNYVIQNVSANADVSSGTGTAFAIAGSNTGTYRDVEYAEAKVDIGYTTGGLSGNNHSAAISEAIVAYTITAENLGISSPIDIPVIIDWSLAVNSYTDRPLNGNRTGSARIAIGGNTSSGFSRTITSENNMGFITSSGTEAMSFSSIGSLNVQLAAGAQAWGGSPFDFRAGAYAYADPVIRIDPDFEFADQFALNYSIPEITNTLVMSTVPIPAAVWLFGSGLIGLIGIARRKKS